MGRARVVCLAFCVAALGFAAPASATTVTVVLTGEWLQDGGVTDNASVTNGSITDGGSFTVTFSYDDATMDVDGDPNIGGYLISGATLTLETGDYTFTMFPTSTVVLGIDNNVDGQDLLGWFAGSTTDPDPDDGFTTSGPLMAGASTGDGFMNPLLTDSTQTAHSSDDLTDLPWSVAAYDSPNLGMNFLIEVLGKGSNKKIELIGEFTQFEVLPEPSTLALGALALLALARARRDR